MKPSEAEGEGRKSARVWGNNGLPSYSSVVETEQDALTVEEKPQRSDESEIDLPHADIHAAEPFIHHCYQVGTGWGRISS